MSLATVRPPESMNSQPLAAVARLSDQDLLFNVKRLAQKQRKVTSNLIAHLAVVDERKLYLGEGYSSLFVYCLRALHLPESATLGSIRAARAARCYPVILEMLESGELNSTNVGLLARHLTPENHAAVLEAARFKRKREVKKIIVQLRPLPSVPASIRKLPTRSAATQSGPGTPVAGTQEAPALSFTGGVALPESQGSVLERTSGMTVTTRVDPSISAELSERPMSVIEPLGDDRYKVQFTANAVTYANLVRAQQLLRHAIPDGDFVAVIDRALKVLVRELEKKKLASTDRPRTVKVEGSGDGNEKEKKGNGTRHIPAAVRREVLKRDGEQCTFTSPDGRRCDATEFLEFDHILPFSAGGATTAENLRILCRAHNGHAADRFFGPEAMKRRIDAARRKREDAGDWNRAEARESQGESEGFMSSELADDGLPLRPPERGGGAASASA